MKVVFVIVFFSFMLFPSNIVSINAPSPAPFPRLPPPVPVSPPPTDPLRDPPPVPFSSPPPGVNPNFTIPFPNFPLAPDATQTIDKTAIILLVASIVTIAIIPFTGVKDLVVGILEWRVKKKELHILEKQEAKLSKEMEEMEEGRSSNTTTSTGVAQDDEGQAPAPAPAPTV